MFFSQPLLLLDDAQHGEQETRCHALGKTLEGGRLYITFTISLRLSQHLLEAIKAAANARDVPYRSLIKVRLQEKVEHR